MKIISARIKTIFHNCKFNTVEIPVSNKKGEIWIEECKCGKKRKVIFEGNDCVSVLYS